MLPAIYFFLLSFFFWKFTAFITLWTGSKKRRCSWELRVWLSEFILSSIVNDILAENRIIGWGSINSRRILFHWKKSAVLVFFFFFVIIWRLPFKIFFVVLNSMATLQYGWVWVYFYLYPLWESRVRKICLSSILEISWAFLRTLSFPHPSILILCNTS